MKEIDKDIVVVEEEIRIPYRYSTGIAGTRFFTELRENGKIMGTKCSNCERVLVPPRIYCEDCMADAPEWVEVPARGTLETFGESYLSIDGKKLKEPWTLGIIKLDGANGGLIHLIGEAAPEDLSIGALMEAVFKPKEERTGSILDIKYFRPVKSSG
jgi:uncharacterized OB-fold protein